MKKNVVIKNIILNPLIKIFKIPAPFNNAAKLQIASTIILAAKLLNHNVINQYLHKVYPENPFSKQS